MDKRGRRIPRKLWVVGVCTMVIVVAAVIGIRQYYFVNLKPVSNNQKSVILTVPSGATVSQIANMLKTNNLIRSAWVFEWYVHSENLTDKLEAGTFALSPSDTLQQIAAIISSGHVAEGIVTILPGKTLDQIETTLINNGFSPNDAQSALNPANYNGLPILADKPAAENTIEGLLYPDSFDKTSATTATQILRESLTEMGQHITPALQASFANEGLNVYQALTLASIIQQEVSKPSDMSQAAQVFLTRLKQGTPLGSDVTANYGAILNGQPPSLSYNSPFNTLIHTGLPPTPIGTVSQAALNAVADPAPTQWLYFVTGDNGVTYFEQTLQQHNADVAQYCHILCSQP